MMNVEIRRPTFDDRDTLHELFRRVITDTFEKENLAHLVEDREGEIRAKMNFLQRDYESQGTERFFWLAVMNDQIIGTIEYGPSSNLIHTLSDGTLKNVAEVGTVLVLPNYQHRGIGKLLFNKILITLRNRGMDEFCLDCGYRRAQRYWKKRLGDPDYLFENYWGEGNDHMIWRKFTNYKSEGGI